MIKILQTVTMYSAVVHKTKTPNDCSFSQVTANWKVLKQLTFTAKEYLI
jgi:hypothetical protein